MTVISGYYVVEVEGEEPFANLVNERLPKRIDTLAEANERVRALELLFPDLEVTRWRVQTDKSRMVEL